MNAMIPITTVNHETWQYLAAYVRRFHYAPTIAEIATALGVSEPAISHRLRCLHNAGWITRQRYCTRGITVNEPAKVEAA
jgi:Mn-dependent DtxR family transcriptional regulator